MRIVSDVSLLARIGRIIVRISSEERIFLSRCLSDPGRSVLEALQMKVAATRDMQLVACFIAIMGNMFERLVDENAGQLEHIYPSHMFFCITDGIDPNAGMNISIFRKFMKCAYQYVRGERVNTSNIVPFLDKVDSVILRCGSDFKCTRDYCWVYIKLIRKKLVTEERAQQISMADLMSPELASDGCGFLLVGVILFAFPESDPGLTADDVFDSCIEHVEEPSGPICLWVAQRSWNNATIYSLHFRSGLMTSRRLITARLPISNSSL